MDVCNKCYLRLQIQKLENKAPPDDEYLKSLVGKKDGIYVDALNLYAASFPKSLSLELFGIFLANQDDEEMNDIIINSMIIAARATLLFGGNAPDKDIEPYKKWALISLGNLIGIVIIGNLTDNYKGLDLKNKIEVSKLYTDINRVFIDILDDIKKHDDGRLEEYIKRTAELIKTSYMFNEVE
ncbi:MAG: hypothetical protein ABIG84_01700 [archaeon]